MITFFATIKSAGTHSPVWAIIENASLEEAVGIAGTHGFNRIHPANQMNVGEIGQTGIEWARKTFKSEPILISKNNYIGKVSAA